MNITIFSTDIEVFGAVLNTSTGNSYTINPAGIVFGQPGIRLAVPTGKVFGYFLGHYNATNSSGRSSIDALYMCFTEVTDTIGLRHVGRTTAECLDCEATSTPVLRHHRYQSLPDVATPTSPICNDGSYAIGPFGTRGYSVSQLFDDSTQWGNFSAPCLWPYLIQAGFDTEDLELAGLVTTYAYHGGEQSIPVRDGNGSSALPHVQLNTQEIIKNVTIYAYSNKYPTLGSIRGLSFATDEGNTYSLGAKVGTAYLTIAGLQQFFNYFIGHYNTKTKKIDTIYLCFLSYES